MSSNRITPRLPQNLNDSQLEYYGYLDSSFSQTWGRSFKIKDSFGAFIGPFGATIVTPTIGRPFFDLAQALGRFSSLSPKVRETAILTVTSHFQTEYATYAHEALALEAGLEKDEIENLKQRQLPPEATSEMETAFEVASALIHRPGALPQGLWEAAIRSFGREGTIALVHFVGLYSYTCIMLNGFDMRVPLI